MDESQQHINPNPLLTSNILSQGFFWWLNPLFKKGHDRPLVEEDLYNVCPSDASEYLGSQLERQWKKELTRQSKGHTPSLLKALIRAFGVQYILLGLVVLLEESTKVIQPLLLGGLIRYFTPDSKVSQSEAWLYAMGVSLCAITLALVHHPYFFSVQRIGMRMRVACCSLMYKKCLRLSNKAMGETTTGQIVNLMSNDVNRFDQSVIFLHFLWVGPLQAIAVLVILWHELGPSVLAGFLVLVLLIPVQGFMGKLFSKLRRKTAVHTDERVKIMNQIISGMKVIKIYCWEKSFCQLIEKIRNLECIELLVSRRTQAFNDSSYFISEKMVLCLTFTVVALTQYVPITAYRVFLTMGLFQVVQMANMWFLPLAVQYMSEIVVVQQRLQRFLLLEELNTSSNVQRPSEAPEGGETCFLQLDKVTAKWDQNPDVKNTLENISLKVEAGQLTAVIGPVGSGKSSLLMCLLGELPADSGAVTVSGKIAYLSQQPWIFSGSVRQNIVFGGVFDKSKYDKIVKVSALKRDFEIMPQGDATLIGDRGVSLSGGQKARVALARALYMDADIYLLDDPLSAVDSAVGRHIFERCIVKYLKNKPRILVTHQVQYLPVADSIFIIKEGNIESQGSFEELSQSGVDFAELLKVAEDEEPVSPTSITVTEVMKPCFPESQEFGSHKSLHSMVDEYEPEAVQLPEEEERGLGTVGFQVYVEYFKAGTGIIKFIVLVMVNIAAQVFYVGSDWWLSQWSNDEEEKFAAINRQKLFLAEHNISSLDMNSSISSNITIPYVDSHFKIYVFTSIILAVFIFGLLRALLFFKITVDAAQCLHNRMFSRLLRSPISFFDTNPVGRILNRFSKDVGHMDDLLPLTFFDFVQCGLLILGIVLVAGVVNPYVFIVTVPLAVGFVFLRRYYLQTSRSIKRLEGTTRSPVFSYLSASLLGLHTIRSMKMEDKFMEEFDSHQDRHSEAWFLFLATSRWLAVRLDGLCAIFVTVVTFCSILAVDTMNAGLVGLSVTYTMTLMGMFQWGVRQSAEVENQMISVERVLEYTCLPMEAEVESEPDKKPPPSWPPSGIIECSGLSLQYSPTGPQVLKDLTFTINSMEKVGIVGRTGAGKSSLVTTLFRLVEPTGKLKIDGIDIQTIGLQDLRTSISMIPQDPVLFTGSLRKNLDPFGANSDEVLWNALNEVKLKEQVSALPEGLDAEVSEGGVNFSVGQRQLICLARAVLTSNKILLIDEATANVDPITDELIQGTIRTKFRDCTVLTIAHRLHTIMDSDRVLVLDNGHIVEFDPPYDLLKQGEGYFYDMAQQTGKAEFDHLYDIARQAAHRNGKVLTLTNGISSKSTKPAEEHATDNTLRDIPSTLTSGENEDATYDISDIEDSLRIASSTTNVDDLKKEEEQEEKEEERVAILEDEIAEPLLPEAGAESRTLSSSPKNVPPLSEDVSGVSGGHEGATSDTSPLISQSGKPEKLGEGKEDKKASEKKDSEEEEDEDDETTGEHEILLKFGSSHSLADDKKKGGGKDDDSSVIDV